MASHGRVVILSHDQDPHLPYVTKFLTEEPLVINTGAIPEKGLSFATRPGSSWPEVTYDGEPLGPIKSVWYRSVDARRLLPPEELAKRIEATLGGNHTLGAHYQLLDDVTGEPGSEYCGHALPAAPAIQEYMASSLNRLAGALPDMIPDAFWISRREQLIHADSKPRQCEIATRLGFDVPATLFTSSDQAAQAFLERHRRCVVKPLAIRPPTGYNQYTTVLSLEDKPSLRGLNVNPHIFQELIEPDYELRIVVAGADVFASIVSDTREEFAKDLGIRDWRFGCERDTFQAEPYELPREVATKCVELTRQLSLVSGMIDIIVKNGTYYFLEINGNGQWAFVDSITVERIGRALAAMLERGTC